jgi:hypothetical protein
MDANESDMQINFIGYHSYIFVTAVRKIAEALLCFSYLLLELHSTVADTKVTLMSEAVVISVVL